MSPSGAARILGIVLALIGLALLIGGIWLAVLGGSIYYLLASLGLLASGYLLFRGNPNGTYLYLLVFALTLVGGRPSFHGDSDRGRVDRLRSSRLRPRLTRRAAQE